MEPMRSAAFDQYARYVYATEIRRRCFGPEPLRILDVGDPFGTIAQLFPGDDTWSLDVFAADPARDGHHHVIGSGFALPFGAASFDMVVAHDVFEHLPAERRNDFLAELVRVSRGPVVVVAPFADPRTELCERLVNGYFATRIGETLHALDEHAEFGLPDLDAATGWLDEQQLRYVVHSDGWLYHWLAFWFVKTDLLARGREDELHRFDAAFNATLRDVDRTAPHYRRAIVVNPPLDGYPEFSPLPGTEGDVAHDIERLGRLAADLALVLKPSATTAAGNRALVRWVEEHRGEQGEYGLLAASLGTAVDVVEAETPGASPSEAPVPVEGAQPAPGPSGALEPTVSVVLVNLNGADHLRDCLDSLALQTYPRDKWEVVLVDNASTDGSLELLATAYPWVRVLPQSTNTGFAPAVNIGVRACSSDCIVLLNNDARVDPDFLTELVARFDPDNGVVCVGAEILSWDGERLDFGLAAVNFYGMGQQVGYGLPLASSDPRDGDELLFACGGAMLVEREVYLNSGGLDDGFFAYFEDVDFGWRLWVLGFRVVLATKAKAYHRMHGTSSRFPMHQRFLLYERNALRTILKNYDDRNIDRVLGPALMLLIKRALVRGNLDRAAFDIGGDRSETEEVPRLALAHFHAVADVLDDLETILEHRRDIQRARRRADDEIMHLFGRPFWPVAHESAYVETQSKVVSAFHLDEVIPVGRVSRLVVISNDAIGEKMSGPAIRALEIARALAGSCEVTVAVPTPATIEVPGVEFEVFTGEQSLVRIVDTADAVLIQGYTIDKFPSVASSPALLIVDLYDPWLFENIELHTGDRNADDALRYDAAVLNRLLDEGDFFICASERQRDYWLGMLSSRGRLNEAEYELDNTLRHLIDVVPFGLPDHAPRHVRRVLKGVHPSIGDDDLVVLWGGGTWDWFDPVTVVDAFAQVVKHVPNAKLYFLGFQLASANVKPMRVAEVARQHAEASGLADTSIIFGDWAPYDLREAYLLESDLAVTATRDLAETRLAFRTRVLDYLWAGLPVVATEGDVLSDLIVSERLGITVSPGDANALADALVALLSDPGRRAVCSTNARQVAARFTWRSAVAPLRRLIAERTVFEQARSVRPRGRAMTEDVRRLLRDRIAEQRLVDDRRLFRDRTFTDIGDYTRHLENIVELQERRIAQIRDLPGVYPAFRAMRRLRGRAAGHGDR